MSERRPLSQLTKNEVLRRQKHRCAKCKEPFGELGVKPHYDHIKRVESRGTNKPENIQALCPNCHSKKTHKEDLKKAVKKTKKSTKELSPFERTDRDLSRRFQKTDRKLKKIFKL